MSSEKDLFSSEGDESRASNAARNQASRRLLIKSAIASVPVVLTLAAGTVRASGRGHGLGPGLGKAHGSGMGQGHGFGQGQGQGRGLAEGQGPGHPLGFAFGDDDEVYEPYTGY